VVGGPMLMTVFLLYFAITSLVPFTSALLGFSRRLCYLMAAILTCGLIYLDAVTFSGSLKYHSVYQLLLTDVWTTALFAAELVIAFVIAHWLGTRFRAGLIWAVNRLRRA
jgi:hypothetical protein